MKCPFCGYDKIQPNFNFCPNCKKSLKDNPKSSQHNTTKPNQQEKGFVNRWISGWTYDKAIADLGSYVLWALKNPNDNRRFLDKWKSQGCDVEIIIKAIGTARRARQEDPTINREDLESTIFDSNRQQMREEYNNDFVDAVNAEYTTNAAAIVRNKAIWKLQPGELARHIAPDEWVYVSEHLEGLVVEEGTSAIIYVDGEEVAQMGSGMYLFDKHIAAAEQEADLREKVKKGVLSRLVEGFFRLFSGHKKDEVASEREARRRRVQQILGRMRKDTIIDVFLKSDRVFPVVFGQQHLADSQDGYLPYTIQSRYTDVNIGVSMQMQIGNFKEFIANYMAGRKNVTIGDVTRVADTSVLSILRYELRDIEITERGLDEQTFNAIKEHLKSNLTNLLHGVKLVDILDIATTNEQLARFRKVEEQLYCSEREYDFLIRTNEFRNRLASAENDQMIRETRSEQELRRRLDEVNRDNILQEDEMEQFVSLLMNQKTIREATNQADLDKAITNIERSKLVTREEFAIFLEDMQNRSFDREQVSEQLRVRSLMATTLSKLEADRTLNIAGIQNAESISEAEFEVLKKDKGREAESWDLEAMVYGRQYVFERQILLDEQERKRTENNFELEQAQHKNKLGAVEIEGKRQDDEYADERTRTKDEYKDERKVKEHKIDIDIEDDNYQREQRKKEDEDRREQKKKEDEARLKQQELENDLNRTERLSRLAAENMQKMKDAELELKKEEHAHDLERQKEDNAHEEEIIRITEATRQKEIEAEQQMNAGQLMAKRVAEMDPEAQAKFAESFSHLNEIELTKANAEQQKELYEKMIKMANDHNIDTKNIQAENSKQQMDVLQKMIDSFTSINTAQAGGQKDLIKTMVDAIQTVAKGKIDDELKLKEEYREQMHHEQERTDENQRQSLNYTTHVKQSENNSFMSGRSSSVNVNINITTCPSCGEPIQDQNSNCCPLCGKSLK